MRGGEVRDGLAGLGLTLEKKKKRLELGLMGKGMKPYMTSIRHRSGGEQDDCGEVSRPAGLV